MPGTWTVLVVDDLPLTRATLRKFLRSAASRAICEDPHFPKVKVIEATNGLEALERLRAYPVDLIYLDLFMPQMDGLTFLAEKAKVDEWGEIPVVVCTSQGERTAKEEAETLGAVAFCEKPLQSAVIAEKLYEAVATR